METPANAIMLEKYTTAKTSTSFLNEDEISLEESLKIAHEAIDIFLNNQFDEARDMVKPFANRSIYHAAIYGVTSLFEALMTFEKNDIEEASNVLSQSCDTINRFRKKTTIKEKIGRLIQNPDYNDYYTDMEVHAELVFAEVLLLKAILIICQDNSLTSLLKGSIIYLIGGRSLSIH